MAFEDLRYRVALRLDYDAEWGGEIATWVWSRLAQGQARQAAEALYWCERRNREDLARELRKAGALMAPRNPFVILPAVLGGIAAALTPMRVHRTIYGSAQAAKGLRRFYGNRARRFAPRADRLYENLTERHLDAFSAFKVQNL